LLNKLKEYGIKGNILKWFESYLTSKKLYIKISNFLSREFEALSGVPQGSHLGPILFLLFINDIVSIFEGVHFLLFADDLKIYKIIRNLMDCVILQNNLDRLHNWCNKK